jgi:hypothetical protein
VTERDGRRVERPIVRYRWFPSDILPGVFLSFHKAKDPLLW